MSATESARSRHDTLRLGLGVLLLQSVERALDVAEPGFGEVGVEGGGVEALVAEEGLHNAQIGAAFDEVGGEGVAQRILTLPMNRPPRSSTTVTIHSTVNR